MQSMVNFLKKQPDQSGDTKTVLESRGESRRDYLAKYMAFQLAKSGRKLETTRSNHHEDLQPTSFRCASHFCVS